MDSELVDGIRGRIPGDRMEQIQSELPRSYHLRYLLPSLVEPLDEAQRLGITKTRARVRLSYGWHMLNEARIALVEADACKLFYEELRAHTEPTEACYWCRFYLDDAALRLYASCEHLLSSVQFYWNLLLPPRERDPKQGRRSLLCCVVIAAELSKEPLVSRDVAKMLRRLNSSEQWRECTRYRNTWVHSERPAISGLDVAVSFGNFDEENLAVLRQLGQPKTAQKYSRMTVGVGFGIVELREAVRGAYGDLHRVYESLVRLLAGELRSLG